MIPIQGAYTLTIETPAGPLTITAVSEGVKHVDFDRGGRQAARVAAGRYIALSGMPFPVEEQVTAYFKKQLKAFTLPLLPEGTPFMQRVWRELLAIPYGEVISYQEQARRCGLPRDTRAVGQCNEQNPLPVLIPCHRVISASGLGGYAGGPGFKHALLLLEGAALQRGGPASTNGAD